MPLTTKVHKLLPSATQGRVKFTGVVLGAKDDTRVRQVGPDPRCRDACRSQNTTARDRAMVAHRVVPARNQLECQANPQEPCHSRCGTGLAARGS
jgi:hypothetical protein